MHEIAATTLRFEPLRNLKFEINNNMQILSCTRNTLTQSVIIFSFLSASMSFLNSFESKILLKLTSHFD